MSETKTFELIHPYGNLEGGEWLRGNLHAHTTLSDGWNQVYVNTTSVPEIVRALRNGRFFASTGVTIHSVSVDGPTIRLETNETDVLLI